MATEYTERLSCEFEMPQAIATGNAFMGIVGPLTQSGAVWFSGFAYCTSGNFNKYTATGPAIETMRSLLASLGCTRKP